MLYMYLILMLIPAGVGSAYIIRVIHNKVKTKKGFFKIREFSPTGKIMNLGFYKLGADGKIRIKRKIDGEKREDLYNAEFTQGYVTYGRFQEPILHYDVTRKQLNLIDGTKIESRVAELDNIIASTYSTAISSIRRNERVTELQKWAPIIIGGVTLLAVWYYCKDIPELFELVSNWTK